MRPLLTEFGIHHRLERCVQPCPNKACLQNIHETRLVSDWCLFCNISLGSILSKKSFFILLLHTSISMPFLKIPLPAIFPDKMFSLLLTDDYVVRIKLYEHVEDLCAKTKARGRLCSTH